MMTAFTTAVSCRISGPSTVQPPKMEWVIDVQDMIVS